MRISIEIECDTIQELKSHLSVLNAQITKYVKTNKLDKHHDELSSSVVIEDDNCYGCHILQVTESETI